MENKRLDTCPQCGDQIIQTNLGGGHSDDYCENCGWPDENRTEQVEPTLFPELNPIKIELVPLFIRKEWKKVLKDDVEVIKDSAVIGPSKVFKDCKFPFTINLYSPEHFIIFFKLNVKSQIVGGETSSKMMATYLSRKTWKKDILKLPKKVDGTNQ